jgi:pyrroloquinoline quinone biosynthesis protein B
MRIVLLGTAAGGGVPQWNCDCPVCREARAGSGRVRPRTQSSVAVSADAQRWFLLNASPDLRAQIERTPALQPRASEDGVRNSPIQAVLLTNADLDHCLGLLSLREGRELFVHAAPSVQRALDDGLSLADVLNCFCGLEWIEPPAAPTPLPCPDGAPSGLLYESFPLPGAPPRFFGQRAMPPLGSVIAYRLTDAQTGGRLLYLPQVFALDNALRRLLPECDVLLFDGTFWSETEMQDRAAGCLTASAMGHVPISGPGGSLEALAALNVKAKAYVHINNTNPILFEDSPERAAVSAAGCIVGFDGMEIAV